MSQDSISPLGKAKIALSAKSQETLDLAMHQVMEEKANTLRAQLDRLSQEALATLTQQTRAALAKATDQAAEIERRYSDATRSLSNVEKSVSSLSADAANRYTETISSLTKIDQKFSNLQKRAEDDQKRKWLATGFLAGIVAMGLIFLAMVWIMTSWQVATLSATRNQVSAEQAKVEHLIGQQAALTANHGFSLRTLKNGRTLFMLKPGRSFKKPNDRAKIFENEWEIR